MIFLENSFDISNFIDNLSCNCKKIQRKTFSKGDIITTYIEKRNQICFLVNGEADLIRYDFNGNKTIIGHFVSNDIFGEAFYPANTNNELFVLAKKKSEVLFLVYEQLMEQCSNNCKFHKDLYSNLTSLILSKVIDLNTRIEVLTKKSIRDKLLAYFNLLSNKKLSKTFYLPFSLTDLSDYLSVDRSAMMRELNHLIQENFIKKSGNKITLLY